MIITMTTYDYQHVVISQTTVVMLMIVLAGEVPGAAAGGARGRRRREALRGWAAGVRGGPLVVHVQGSGFRVLGF